MSAVTTSPSFRINTSPGTIREEGTVAILPSLSTFALFSVNCWSAFIEASAFSSCQKPIVLLTRTNVMIRVKSIHSPTIRVINAATRST